MILTGPQIEAAVTKNEIVIHPFRKHQLEPNSYDFRLGNSCSVYTDKALDAARENKLRSLTIPKTGLVLKPDQIYLVKTEETLGSGHYVPIIRGRSSVGRLGIFINITSDLIELGVVEPVTLQIHVVHPVRVYPGMLIGQITFWRTYGRRK